MAFKIQHHRHKKRQSISDINITPFVDVLLVLLIIFMVAAPMMTSGVDIELPQGSTAASSDKEDPVTISIKSDGTIFLQDQNVKLNLLAQSLLKITSNNLGTVVYVRADKNIDYGRVMEIVRKINLSGFSKVVLVTELVQS